MERYSFHIPRWYGAGFLIVSVLITIGFIQTMLQNNVLQATPWFFVTASVMLLFGLVIAVYVFVTGKYPMSMRPRIY